MGEAKRKRRGTDAFLKSHPSCCFCGGTTPATTVDHIPSRQMFLNKHRPKGLEVPACLSCNQATRHHEQIAAMMGRIFPDGETAEEQEEIAKIMRAVSNNYPGLLEEMMPSEAQIARGSAIASMVPDIAGVLNCSGPLLNGAIQKFGAKLGLGLHYSITGRIVPLSGGVAVRWWTNYDHVTGEIPERLFEILGPEETLCQGKWSVGEQFTYSSTVGENKKMGAYFSTYRMSFAVLCWVIEDGAKFARLGDKVESINRPGRF